MSGPTKIDLPPLADLTRIGGGRSADVYALPGERVLKLFRDHADATVAAREAAAARLAAGQGARVATPLATVEIDGRVGLVSERLHGETGLRRMRGGRLRLFGVLRDLARYQAALHRAVVEPGALVDLDQAIAARIGWAEVDPATADAARAALAGCPRGDRLCHGDLHPANLLLTAEGPAAIDWSGAVRGDPAGDVARTELLLRFAGRGAGTQRALRTIAARWYRRCYVRASGIDAAAIDAWLLPVAVAWLQPGSAADADALRAFIAGELSSPARGRWQRS